MKEKSDAEAINLPIFDVPQKEWRPKVVRLEDVIAETEPLRRYYLEHYDDPEKRLRSKNPEPFRWLL